MKLRCERLEDRCTPAGFFVNGSTLEYVNFGETQRHEVTIVDDGAGNVAGTVDGVGTVASGISTVEVISFGSGDDISYSLQSPRTELEKLFVFTEGQSNVVLNDSPGTQSGMLVLYASRMSDSGSWNVHLGPVSSGAMEVSAIGSYYSAGSVSVSRAGTVDGLAIDTVSAVESAGVYSYSYAGLIGSGGILIADTFDTVGYSGLGTTLKENIVLDPASTGVEKAAMYGNPYSGDVLQMSVTDTGDPNADGGYIRTTQANVDAGNVSASGAVEIVLY